MRTRTLITGAAFLAVSAAGTASAQLQLKGSDTLELVTKDVIVSCGLTSSITYVGGGSGTGQAAMVAATPTQHVAPMSRQMNNTASCTTNSRQLLIGLDGLSIVAKNSTHSDPANCTDDIQAAAPLSLTNIPTTYIPCTSNAGCAASGLCDIAHQFCLPGGTLGLCTAAQGCSPDGTYTFDNASAGTGDDWKDVLAMIYGGQNHNANFNGATNPQLINDQTETNADGTAICTGTRACKRNPTRVDCASPVRGVLLASYGSIVQRTQCTANPAQSTCQVNSDCPFNQTCNAGLCTCAADNQCGSGSTCSVANGQCTANQCVKLKHAFRRDDLSGTTDAFQALVGLVAIAPFTTLRSSVGGSFAPEIADALATTSPFCNGGTAALNKGFTDGLDLDPYRRACNAGPSPDRLAYESVCQAFAGFSNSDSSCYVAVNGLTSPVNYPQRERTAPQGRGFLAGGSVDTLAALQTDYLTNTATRPRCLGVVLPVSIPTDVVGSTVWATDRYPPGGNCTPGVRAFVNPLAARAMLCPNGLQKPASGTCVLPQNTSNGRFDCVVDSPQNPGANISDSRIYNLMPVNSVGHMGDPIPNTLTDAYANPNFGAVSQLRRFARRYYGLHMVRPDNTKKQATISGGCTLTDDTSQIGCLVKASPCSIGFAGREAADSVAPFNNLGLKVAGVQATQTTIENLATGGSPIYPMARKLWFNSVQPDAAGERIGFIQPNLTDPELALSVCMGLPSICATNADCTAPAVCDLGTLRCTAANTSQVDAAILAHNFVVVPPTVQRLILSAGKGCPLP